ncbi:hypothetical protein C5167_021999 [Papaver somniferum]|uniref:eRF1 domain-containing protein n=1 Tax=Papaver somniferum TaxID=3469 RepID=A0A4Y7JHL3_PAPSO|nr:eukaryotic peptide chain release factor GTP-binding subunit-like isoform X2 [Papaver somniferum]RZC60247.1 hypothetical protein C5167_021999 [Papaver somniferum]
MAVIEELKSAKKPKSTEVNMGIVNEKPQQRKRHLNAVLVHADNACGHILCPTYQVEENRAQEGSANLWKLEQIDCNNEQFKSDMVEVRKASFETENTVFTILEDPSVKKYVPSRFASAQPDMAVWVISALGQDFRAAVADDKFCQSHVFLATTCVSKLLVIVNKMGDPLLKWSKDRYMKVVSKMKLHLRCSGFDVKKGLQFIPVDSVSVDSNIQTRVSKSTCSWWDGPCLFEALDSMEVPEDKGRGPFWMSINHIGGTYVEGTIESGKIRAGDTLQILLQEVDVKVLGVSSLGNRVNCARPREYVKVELAGMEEKDFKHASILSNRPDKRKSLFKPNDRIGFLVTDLKETVFGSLRGVEYEVIDKFRANLPSIKAHAYYTELHSYTMKVREKAGELFGSACLIVVGRDDFHLQFVSKSNTNILKDGYVDYGGNIGFEEAIYSSSDLLCDVRLLEEHSLIGDLFEQICCSTGKYAVGIQSTSKALDMGVVDTLIVWDNFKDDTNILKNIIRENSVFSLEVVTDRSKNGNQFCKQFSGIGAILKSQIDVDDDDINWADPD